MNENIVRLLQEQMNNERQNSQIYLYVASICENLAYDGFAKFFRKQAQEELGHAHLFEEFLISKRIQPIYDSLKGILFTPSLPIMTQTVANLEKETTANLRNLYDEAESEDAQVCALLDKLLLEQIEEETWSADLADLVARVDATGWLILDERYGKD